jgi:uncharacterized protein YsxB (DUF464 family)
MNVLKAADLLISKIKKDYKDDIAIVTLMGSHLYQDTHARSDLDMYFIPKTKRGYDLGFVFIIDGIGFDFWPISWERMEKISRHEERIGAILTEGKVLYYGNDDDLKKFNHLKEQAKDKSNQALFTQKAIDKIDLIDDKYYRLMTSHDISSTRREAINIIYHVCEAISLLNQEPIKRGRAKLKSEILQMKYIPKGFNDLYDKVFTCNDLKEIQLAYQQLIISTKALIKSHDHEIKRPFKDEAFGFYEELINSYNKIAHACEINDPYTALFAGVEIYQELDGILGNTEVSFDHLPDLLKSYDPHDLSKYALVAKKHQLELEKTIKSHGVDFKTFKDFDDLALYLDQL